MTEQQIIAQDPANGERPFRKDLPYNVAKAVRSGFNPSFAAEMRLEVLQNQLDTVCGEIHDLLQNWFGKIHPNGKIIIDELVTEKEKAKAKILWELESIRRWQRTKQVPKNQITPEMIEKAMQFDIIEILGNPVRKHGHEYIYRSPFRQDRDPSLHFNIAKGLWIDRGTGEGGSIIDLAMRINGQTFVEAVKSLI